MPTQLQMLSGTLLAALVGLPVAAAPITWSIVNVTGGSGIGDAAVRTDGQLIEASNFGGLNVPDALVNGVNFEGVNFEGGAESPSNLVGLGYINSQSGNGESGIGAIDVMFDTIGFRSGTGFTDADISGLTPGQQYLVQFFLSHTNTASRTQRFDDGEGNTIVMKNANPSQAVTGLFTADAGSQFVSFRNLNPGSQLLSGYQLRAVPSPSGMGFVGMLGLAAWRRRRR